MSELLPSPKHRTTGPEARERLLEAVTQLASTVPFPEITARRIAREVGMDSNVIFRNFETLENLYLAALRRIEVRAIEYLESNPPIGFMPIGDMFLWMRFAAWLTLSGTDPLRISSDAKLLERFRTASLDTLSLSDRSSERGKSAVLVIALAYIQAQALLTPTQPDIFTEQAMEDSLTLLATLVEGLDGLSAKLGWD